jgi:hypothetical protein
MRPEEHFRKMKELRNFHYRVRRIEMSDTRQHVHELVDELEPSQLAAVGQLLEVMVHDEDDELTDEDRRAVAASREYFRKGGEGTPLEQVVAECGFTMDQIRNYKGGPTSE